MGKASRNKGEPERTAEMARRGTERNIRSKNTTRAGFSPIRGNRTFETTDVAAALKRKQRSDRRKLKRMTDAAATAAGKLK